MALQRKRPDRALAVVAAVFACLIWWGALAEAAAPTRTKTYTNGQTADAGDVTENEDNIFVYLQTGVDTYLAGSVNAAAIASDAVGSAEIAAGAVGSSELAAGAVESTVLSISQSTTGVVATTGAGFRPTRGIFICHQSTGAGPKSWSVADDAAGEIGMHENVTGGTGVGSYVANIVNGGNDLSAVLTSWDADGLTLTWSGNAGLTAECRILVGK